MNVSYLAFHTVQCDDVQFDLEVSLGGVRSIVKLMCELLHTLAIPYPLKQDNSHTFLHIRHHATLPRKSILKSTVLLPPAPPPAYQIRYFEGFTRAYAFSNTSYYV